MRARKRGRKLNSVAWVNSSRMAGSSVMASTAAMAMEKFLVKASGLNRRPSCASSVKMGMNETAMTSSAKKLAGATSLTASITTCVVIALASLRFPHLQLLVGLLHHHDGRVHHGADGNGNSAQRHDVGSHSHHLHGNEGNQNRNRNGQDRNQGAGNVPEEDQNHQADDDDFLDRACASECRWSAGSARSGRRW